PAVRPAGLRSGAEQAVAGRRQTPPAYERLTRVRLARLAAGARRTRRTTQPAGRVRVAAAADVPRVAAPTAARRAAATIDRRDDDAAVTGRRRARARHARLVLRARVAHVRAEPAREAFIAALALAVDVTAAVAVRLETARLRLTAGHR